MELGTRIKNLRVERGLSQEALAAQLEISRQAIAKWESGQSRPSTANLLALCEVFGVPLNELVAGEDLGGEVLALPQQPRRNWKMQAALLALTLLSLSLSVAVTISARNARFPEWAIGGADGPTSIIVSVPYMFGVPTRALPVWIITTGLIIVTGITFFCEWRKGRK